MGEACYDSVVTAGARGLLGTRHFMPPVIAGPSGHHIIGSVSIDANDTSEDRDVFGGGSCTNHSATYLSRACFSLVQVSNEEDLVEASYYTLPYHHPQTLLMLQVIIRFLCQHATRES